MYGKRRGAFSHSCSSGVRTLFPNSQYIGLVTSEIARVRGLFLVKVGKSSVGFDEDDGVRLTLYSVNYVQPSLIMIKRCVQVLKIEAGR